MIHHVFPPSPCKPEPVKGDSPLGLGKEPTQIWSMQREVHGQQAEVPEGGHHSWALKEAAKSAGFSLSPPHL